MKVGQTETEPSGSGFSWKDIPRLFGCILTMPFALAAGLIFLPLIIAAPGVLIVQCFLWLREGEWVGLSATLFFKYFLSPESPFVQWLDSPESWLGVHKLITATPLSVFLLLVGIAVFLLYFLVGEWMSALVGRKQSHKNES